MPRCVNTLRPRQNGCHFADDTFDLIFVNENVRISIKFSLKFVPKGPITNIPALVQIMAWRRPGDKPLSEPVMVSLLTHICVIRPQWVKQNKKITCMILHDGYLTLHAWKPCIEELMKFHLKLWVPSLKFLLNINNEWKYCFSSNSWSSDPYTVFCMPQSDQSLWMRADWFCIKFDL